MEGAALGIILQVTSQSVPNHRIQLAEAHDCLLSNFRAGISLVKTRGHRSAAGCNANIRIYRYAVGQRFGKHIDESVEDENGHVSYWTVLIYLNGGTEGSTPRDGGEPTSDTSEALEPLRGGETVFYKAREACLTNFNINHSWCGEGSQVHNLCEEFRVRSKSYGYNYALVEPSSMRFLESAACERGSGDYLTDAYAVVTISRAFCTYRARTLLFHCTRQRA